MSVLMFPLLVKSGGGGSGGSIGKKGPSVPPCPTITNINCTVGLPFFFPYSGQLTSSPEFLSDPGTQVGTTNPSDVGKYYCKITVEPAVPSNCTVSPYIYYWTQAANSMVIQIPQQVTSKFTIEFYERCGFYDNASAQSRRYWKFTTTLSGGQTIVNPSLMFVAKIFGC